MRNAGARFETAGMALAGADISIRQPAGISYSVPRKMRLGDAHDLKSPVITRPGPRRRSWPWVPDGGPVLMYQRGSEVEQRWSPSTGTCLREFIQLADASETQFPKFVLSFAQRWGPLELCEHAKPFKHYAYPRKCMSPDSSPAFDPWSNEPLEAWRRYSRHLKGLLLVAANLCEGYPGHTADWDAVEEGEPADISKDVRDGWGSSHKTLRPNKKQVVGERLDVAYALSHWLEYGQVALQPQWRTGRSTQDHRFEIDTTYWGLTGRLAVDLAASLCSPNGIYRCAGCGIPFTSEDRMRARNREKWCDEQDCKLERDRRNSKRYYEKKMFGQEKQKKKSKAVRNDSRTKLNRTGRSK